MNDTTRPSLAEPRDLLEEISRLESDQRRTALASHQDARSIYATAVLAVAGELDEHPPAGAVRAAMHALDCTVQDLRAAAGLVRRVRELQGPDFDPVVAVERQATIAEENRARGAELAAAREQLEQAEREHAHSYQWVLAAEQHAVACRTHLAAERERHEARLLGLGIRLVEAER